VLTLEKSVSANARFGAQSNRDQSIERCVNVGVCRRACADCDSGVDVWLGKYTRADVKIKMKKIKMKLNEAEDNTLLPRCFLRAAYPLADSNLHTQQIVLY
jgi:hypothetical protein